MFSSATTHHSKKDYILLTPFFTCVVPLRETSVFEKYKRHVQSLEDSMPLYLNLVCTHYVVRKKYLNSFND